MKQKSSFSVCSNLSLSSCSSRFCFGFSVLILYVYKQQQLAIKCVRLDKSPSMHFAESLWMYIMIVFIAKQVQVAIHIHFFWWKFRMRTWSEPPQRLAHMPMLPSQHVWVYNWQDVDNKYFKFHQLMHLSNFNPHNWATSVALSALTTLYDIQILHMYKTVPKDLLTHPL